MTDLLNTKDFVGAYGKMLELGLRAGNIIQNGFERSVREHLAYVQNLLSSATPANLTQASPQEFVNAQVAGVQQSRDLLAATTKRLMEIQQEVGAELKALTEEATSKLTNFKVN
jgi:Phasin protein